MKFPKNMLVTLTHAGYKVPDGFEKNLHPDIKNNDFRLLKNFSDFGTNSLISQSIPAGQVLRTTFSRAFGDTNRAIDAEDFFRETDFNENHLFNRPLTTLEKEEFIEQIYGGYHNEIQKKIDTAKFDLLIDVHDTGNRLLAPLTKDDSDRNPPFCDICISNGDGETCSDELLSQFAELLTKHTGLTVQLNDPYKGGFVTRYYGEQISTIQVEFNRSLYMDERRQAIEPHLVAKLRDGLYHALCDLKEYI